ncbi:MAG TPA: aspartate aminotransferase family protein [Gaiellaceae bacterium]
MTEAATSVRRSTTRSAELFERASRVLVDGVSSPSRGPLNFSPYPLFMTGGEGGEIVDADGNRYVDLMLGFGALIHGHAHPRLVAALNEAGRRGALLATASEIEVEVAERLVQMIPGAERIRFANTGTEACMAALRLVRGVTGRPKVVKFEGHYHGWSDAFSVGSNPGVPDAVDSLGIPPSAVVDTIVLPWNDADRVEAALTEHRGQIAAIVTEPVMANMGVIPPVPGYLEELRRLADEHEVLLWLDETVTGFRLAAGGAQERLGVRADLVTFGKALGAGFPVAALAGPAKIMEALAGGRVLHYGTQNANPTLLAVVRESLDLLTPEAFAHLDGLAEQLVAGLRAAISDTGAAALVQNSGPMLQLLFLQDRSREVTAIRDARDFSRHVNRDRFRAFAHALFDEGVYLSPATALHSVLATVHTPADVERVVQAARAALARV